MSKIKTDSVKKFLDRKAAEFNQPTFINNDPVCIPHQFQKKQDIEIAGFFAAIFAWGIRKTIIKKASHLMALMDDAPHDFICHHQESDLKRMLGFCHRTFNGTDLLYFISFFKHHYARHDSLEAAFQPPDLLRQHTEPMESRLNYFYQYFFSLEDVPPRTLKHIASPQKKSACKRINMFLRWMVRSDNQGVDFGIWTTIKPSELICPVDLHVARVAKRFGLLERNQVDWQAAVELTENLRKLDNADPVQYDYALFGLGILEKF